MSNKVIYAKCNDYNQENVDQAVDFIINNLDNFEEKIKNAKTILIKPNLISDKAPDKAVTTHPQVLISLINRIKPYCKNIIIADTPAGKMNKARMEKLYEITEMNRVAKETGCPVNWDLSDFIANTPDSKLSKHYTILNVAEKADLIINVAKLKTHSYTKVTLSTKNLFGLIPGLIKIQYHLTMSKLEFFANMLLDIERYFDNKTIHFIDGITGMEGSGPTNGTPINANCLLAGENALYLDILACYIMGVEPSKNQTIVEAKKRNIINSLNVNDLNIVKKDNIETFKFELPVDTKKVLPSIVPTCITNIINSSFVPKPKVLNKDCTGCKACEEMCPPQIIKIQSNKACITNYNKCIRCYCCQEICPNNAIEISKPIGRKLLEKFIPE